MRKFETADLEELEGGNRRQVVPVAVEEGGGGMVRTPTRQSGNGTVGL